MREFPRGGLIGKTVHSIRTISRLNISLYAANASFFVILALFPALVLLLSLLRYTDLAVEDFIYALDRVIPQALMDTAQGLIENTYENSSGALVGVSAVTALWSAGRGIHGVMTGLNAVYGAEESRGYFYTRLISMAYTFAFLLVLLLTLVLHVFGNLLVRWLQVMKSPVFRFLVGVLDLRFFVLLIVQTLIFTLMFMVLPNERNSFRDSIPGALLASIGWLVFSDAYSIYVEHFSGFANVYGSVYAVALSMLWLYCCVSIVFYGGALNRYLARKN